MAKEKWMKACFTWMSWVWCLLSWQPLFFKAMRSHFLLGLSFFYSVLCLFSLLVTLLMNFLQSLCLCLSAYFFTTCLFSNTRPQTLKSFNLSLFCNVMIALIWLLFFMNLSFPWLFASPVMLLCIYLVHHIFWEAADSHTTASLQHLMYLVLHLQSNIK